MSKTSEHKSQKPAGPQQRIQQVLLEALAESRLRNPAYSLRALSRKLKISPAALSEILNGKRIISAKLAGKILTNLGCDPARCAGILAAFSPPSAPDSSSNNVKKSKSQSYTILPTDQFRTIADWYHFAILSLFETTSSPQDIPGIASRLGVRRSDIATALDRLVRLGMLLRGQDGRYELTGKHFHSSDGITSSAVKASHAQSFQLAQKSLEEDPIPLCDFTSLTMAINPERIEKARKMIREFRTKIAAELEVDEKQEVYMLCVQLFPLSRTDKISQDDNGGRKHDNA